MAYFFVIFEWLARVCTAVGDFAQMVGYKITHDPLWGGITVGVVVLIIALLVLKARLSRL